jgi:hypothetical protein
VLLVVAVLSATRVAGQSSRPAAAARSPAATTWTPPRTTWGDPDLSGIYSNSDESGIPFEPRRSGNQQVSERLV